MTATKPCMFYMEVKDLKEDESKIFNCGCSRHGSEISVIRVDGVVREVMLSPESEESDTYAPETYEHMLTVLMIMFGDAREQESEKLNKDAFEYAKSWLKEYNEIQAKQP